MFCLRTWLLPLLFLSNAPPLYLLLFLLATYILQRPCLYCTLLLFLIIITLFDFKGDWFGDDAASAQLGSGDSNTRTSDSTQHQDSVMPSHAVNSTAEALKASASLVGGMLNETAGALVDSGMQQVSRVTGLRWSWGRTGLEWLRDIAQRREFRIDCLDTIVRL